MTWSFGQILRPSMFMELLNLSSRYNIFFLSNSNWKLWKSLGDRGDKLYCISHEWDQHHQQEDQWEAEDSEDIGASWERSSLPWDWQVNDARNLLFSEAQIWISTIQNSWRVLSLNIQGSGWKRKVKKSVSNLKKNTFHILRRLATTHFEPTYARRAFPCFDEPQLKAEFTVTITHHKEHSVFFNMPLNSQTMVKGYVNMVSF